MNRTLLLGAGAAVGVSGGSPATYVGYLAMDSASSANQDVSIAGLSPANGDLCIVAFFDNPTSTMNVVGKGTGVGLTAVLLGGTQSSYRWNEGGANDNSNRVKVFARALNSTEVSNGNLTISGVSGSTGVLVLLYRGATTVVSAALPNFQTANSTSAPGVTGFTPSGSTKGAVIINATRVSGANGNLNVTNPTDWNTRVNNEASWLLGSLAVVDRMSGYAGGTITLNHTALGTSLNEIAFMLELQ